MEPLGLQTGCNRAKHILLNWSEKPKRCLQQFLDELLQVIHESGLQIVYMILTLFICIF